MIYANPAPEEFASGEYYDRTGAEYYLSPAKLESDYAPVRFERELRLFRKHCRGGAVLDVGCSSGAFLFQLSQRFPGCYDILGTDVSGPPLDYTESRGVPVMRGDFLAGGAPPEIAENARLVLRALYKESRQEHDAAPPRKIIRWRGDK